MLTAIRNVAVGVPCQLQEPYGGLPAGATINRTDMPCPWPGRVVVEFDDPAPHGQWQTGLCSVGEEMPVRILEASCNQAASPGSSPRSLS